MAAKAGRLAAPGVPADVETPKLRTAAQILVSMLEVNGIDRVFCLPGESFLPVLDALLDSPIETVTCRHESSAGFMAVADARLTGKPGICLVSRGPGATNAAIAIHTAQQDGLPLIVFIGQVPRKNLRRDGFQEIDYGKMFGDVAKMVAEITDPDRMPEVLARAFNLAIGGTPGPVIISLSEDILALPVKFLPCGRPREHLRGPIKPASTRQCGSCGRPSSRSSSPATGSRRSGGASFS